MTPIPIRLKLRYRHGMPAKQQKSPGGVSGNSKRNKLNQEAKKRLPKGRKLTLVVEGSTGHAVFEELH